MRAFHLAFAALALSSALGACSEKSGALVAVKTTPAAVETLVTKLAAETFKGKATAAADIASVRDALPKEVSLTWTALTFDAATGATVLTGVKLTPKDSPQVGLSAEEVRLWDFDSEFAKARLSGQRLTETASLARRIDTKGISVFGLETLMPKTPIPAIVTPVTPAPTDPTSPAVTETFPSVEDVMAETQMSLDSYNFTIARVLIDDVVLRPYEFMPAALPAGSEFAEFLPVAQRFAAVSRTFAANAMALFDMKAALAMTQGDQKMVFDVDLKTMGSRGWRGGDTDASFARGLSFNANVPGGMTGISQSIGGNADFYSIEGTRLDKLYGYLARGQWPPRTETDLLSVGLFTAKNATTRIGGVDFYTTAQETLDARKFHWFVPTDLKTSARGVTYNIDGLLNYIASIDPAMASNPDGAAGIQQAREIATRNGFAKITYDTDFSWTWNPQTGAAKIGASIDLKDLMSFDLAYDGGFPSFKAISDLVPEKAETTNMDAISEAFSDLSTLKSAQIDIADKGGLEKIYALSADIAKMAGASAGTDGNVAGNLTPQGVRQMAVAGVYMAADQGAAQMPQLKELLTPIAEFLDKGGKLRITAKPRKPLVYAAASQSVMTGESSPQALTTQLNMKVVHTPPAGAK